MLRLRERWEAMWTLPDPQPDPPGPDLAWLVGVIDDMMVSAERLERTAREAHDDPEAARWMHYRHALEEVLMALAWEQDHLGDWGKL